MLRSRSKFEPGWGFLTLFCAISSVATAFDAPGIDPTKVLLIRDISVVGDARASGDGAWSAGTQLKRLSGSRASAAFVESWLETWNQTSMNDLPVVPRSTERILKHWPRNEQGALDVAQAPFRLMAIAYRPDIGQGRLLYSLFDSANLNPIELTLIFEYRLPGEARAWAREFQSLGALPFGEAYNARLEALTERFARRENLLQVRTNDFELEIRWEFRQFKLDSQGLLKLTPLTQTPHDSYREGPASDELVAWLRENGERYRKEEIELPARMLGGTTSIPKDSFRWLEGRGLPEQIRHDFAMSTCSGCHGGETVTLFTHVFPRNVSGESEISDWLKGDLERRGQVLQGLLRE
jgi:hypothetical protein